MAVCLVNLWLFCLKRSHFEERILQKEFVIGTCSVKPNIKSSQDIEWGRAISARSNWMVRFEIAFLFYSIRLFYWFYNQLSFFFARLIHHRVSDGDVRQYSSMTTGLLLKTKGRIEIYSSLNRNPNSQMQLIRTFLV